MEVRESYKQTEIGVIPSDWELFNLGKSSTLKARIGWQGLTTAEYLSSGDYYLITGTDFKDGYIDWDNCVYVEKERYVQDKNIQVKVEDILVTKDGTIGKVAFVDKVSKETTLNSGVFVVRPMNKIYNSRYLYYILMSEYFKEFLNRLTAGSTISHLYQKDFVFFEFPKPTLIEQTAIATALSDTDAWINSLEQLLTKKRQIKQGAMQELLKPNPEASGGWEVKKLGDVCEIKKGQLITEQTRILGEIPVIAGGKKPAYYHNKPNRKGITITISGSGANAGYVSIHHYPIFASDCSTINENEKYSIEYIYFLLINIQEKIYKMQTGGAQPHIHPSDLSPIIISIPNLQEQTRIATILSDIDEEIGQLESKLEKAKQLKQGMMQELLTGKTRLI